MFMCRRCYTQFASAEVVHSWIFPSSLRTMCVNLSPPYFNLNVQPQQHLIGTTLIAFVSCAVCNMVMGFKRVNSCRVSFNFLDRFSTSMWVPQFDPNHADQQGLVALYLSLLCFQSGEVTFSLMVPLPMDLPLPPPPHGHDPPFFLCKACDTLVAWKQGLIDINIECRIFFFSDCIQLVVDPPEYHWILQNGSSTIAYVRCGGCNSVLGMKIVPEDDPDNGLQLENIGLNMTRLNIWNGIDFHVFSIMQSLPPP